MFTKHQSPWVKLAADVTFDHAVEAKGTVGIKVGPARTLNAERQVVEIAGHSEVHLVHVTGGTSKVTRSIDGVTVVVDQPYRGGDTRQIVAVRDELLELVTDRNDVPAERLATYDPDWQPRAARAGASAE
jgi:hypothetical protein